MISYKGLRWVVAVCLGFLPVVCLTSRAWAGIGRELQAAKSRSRMISYAGYDKTIALLESLAAELGFEHVYRTEFDITVPVDEGAAITVDGREFTLYHFEPNLVAFGINGRDALSAELIYVGDGDPRRLKGRTFDGKIVVMDLVSGRQWLQLVNLGAEAFIFLQPGDPEDATYQEYRCKVLETPVEIPRFLLPRESAAEFIEIAERGGTGSISSRAGWKKVPAVNLSIYIPGTEAHVLEQEDKDKGPAEHVLMIHVNADAISLVPGLAPGGDNVFNLEVFERLLRHYRDNPCRTSLLFTAFSGNAFAISGARNFAYKFVSEKGRPKPEDRDEADEYMDELTKLSQEITDEAISDPVPFLRKACEEHGHRYVLIKYLYGLVSLEKTSVSDQIRAVIHEIEREGKDDYSATRKFVKRREELDYLYMLKKRRFLPQEEVAKQVPPFLKIFRSSSADEPDDPALVATARSNLGYLLKELREQFAVKIEEEKAEIEQLEQVLKFARFMTDKRIVFNIALDVSSSASGLTIASEGDHINYLRLQPFSRRLGEALIDFTERFNREHSEGTGTADMTVPPLLNALPGGFEENWRLHVHYTIANGTDALALLRIPGVTLCGSEDIRAPFDTPEDTIERALGDGSVKKIALSVDCTIGLVTEADWMLRNVEAMRHKLLPQKYEPDNSDWGQVVGRAVRPSAETTDTEVSGIGGALVVERGSTMKKGLRNTRILKADGVGRFFLLLVPRQRIGKKVILNAFCLDEQTGRITKALDKGTAGAFYPTEFFLGQEEKATALPLFDCKSISVIGCFDPRTWKSLQRPNILSGFENSELRMFGRYEVMAATEAVTTCFVPPTGEIKLVYLGPGLFVRMMLLNSDKDEALGHGFRVTESRVLKTPEIQSARDMWWRTEELRTTLTRAGIKSAFIDYLQQQARKCIDEAQAALSDRDYIRYQKNASMAWSMVSRSYPTVLHLANSTVYGLVFYLLLILPCSMILERLFFGFTRILARGITMLAIGVALYLIVSSLHPAFRVMQNPMVLFMAFGLISLTSYTIILLWFRFEGYITRWKERMRGLSRESMSRGAAFGITLSVVIGNMRRAPARALLTVASLTLFTIVVVSLISVRSALTVNTVEMNVTPSYEGLMIRDPKHEGMAPEIAGRLSVLYGEDSDICEIRVADKAFSWIGKWKTKACSSGLPKEIEKKILVKGKGLDSARYACLLPAIVDEETKVDTAALVGETRIISGLPITVVGLFDPGEYELLLGPDGEPMTPIDMPEMRILQDVNKKMGQKDIEIVAPRVPAEQSAIVNDALMEHLGGIRDAVVLISADTKRLREIASDMSLRTDFYCYLGEGSRSIAYSISDRPNVKGLADIGIPVFICSLIILNTMLGAVAAQLRHIPTFSAVGLAPKQIANLFFVESLVYAVIAVMFGFISGQLTAKIITHFNIIPGMVLDYSSSTALLGCFIVIGVAQLSTVYPAFKAFTVATPKTDIEDKPTFEGDRMRAILPFALTGAQAAGGIGFLFTFIMDHDEVVGAESFFIKDPGKYKIPGSGGKGFFIDFDMWLAPIDLGNSQKVRIWTEADEHEVMYIHVEATWITGDLSSWQTCNLGFLTTLRKQMLLWRMVEEEEREWYIQMAESLPEAPPDLDMRRAADDGTVQRR